MLNNSFAAKFTVNSVPGTIVKSHPKSRFMTAHINTTTVADLMRDDNVVILQIMQCQEGAVIIESVGTGDYAEGKEK